jgi:hypothetical protein
MMVRVPARAPGNSTASSFALASNSTLQPDVGNMPVHATQVTMDEFSLQARKSRHSASASKYSSVFYRKARASNTRSNRTNALAPPAAIRLT